MEDGLVSKTQRKKEMHALQDLGSELLNLNTDRLAELDLPEALQQAVEEAHRLKGFAARRRQLQYIGRLMRNVNPAPIRERLAVWEGTSRARAAWMHDLERWRERLIADPDTLTDLAALHPRTDVQHLHALIRNARAEAQTGKPPKHFRALFQVLKAIIPEPVTHKVESDSEE